MKISILVGGTRVCKIAPKRTRIPSPRRSPPTVQGTPGYFFEGSLVRSRRETSKRKGFPGGGRVQHRKSVGRRCFDRAI